MAENDSTSEDDDYEPTKNEIREADADSRKQKRQRLSETEVAFGQAKAAKSNAKVEEIWQRLKGALGSDKAAKVNVVSLCNSSSQTSTNREWMQQLGIKSFQAPQQYSFLSKSNSQAQQQSHSQYQAPSQMPVDPNAALRALAAAKAAVSGSAENADGQISMMETRRFAGKNIQVSKLATAEEAEKVREKEKEKDAKKSGIDAVLASLEAAKKVNVLDKSRDDWGQFKKTDAEIEQELDAYKKSGGKYLDKVDFLKRSEMRQYEAERDQRLAGDIRNRGRM